MIRTFSAVLLLSLRMMASQASPPVPDSDAEASSLAHLAFQLMPEFGKVRFHREEELEDSLYTLGSASISVPHLFRIQSAPEDGEVRTGGIPTMYVAISRDGSTVYHLAGFPDAERSFNDLVGSQLSSRRLTKLDAESRGLLCSEIVYGVSSSWWVGDVANVQLMAARHFFEESHKDGLRLAGKWWKSAKGDRAALEIVTLSKGDGFEVDLPVFYAPVEGHSDPEVQLYRIEISSKGTCTMPVAPAVVLR